MNCSINLYGQNNIIPSLEGVKDSLVVVNIFTIKEANIKLIERNYLKEIINQQDTIILDQQNVINNYRNYNLYLADENLKLQKVYNDVDNLNKSFEKTIKIQKAGLWALSGVSVAAITVTLINLLISGK